MNMSNEFAGFCAAARTLIDCLERGDTYSPDQFEGWHGQIVDTIEKVDPSAAKELRAIRVEKPDDVLAAAHRMLPILDEVDQDQAGQRIGALAVDAESLELQARYTDAGPALMGPDDVRLGPEGQRLLQRMQVEYAAYPDLYRRTIHLRL